MLETLLLKGTVKWFTPEGDETVIVDDSVVDDPQDGVDGGGADEPFLQVNDRTTYKTREEALKGFEEAQKTITSLSGFKKALEDLGAPKDADANYLKGLLTEYIRLAQAEKAAKAAAPSKKTTSSEDDKEFEGMSPELVAQTKRGREWLKQNAEKVGLISQEKFNALQEKLNALEGGLSSRAKAEVDAAISEGQQKVTTWLGEAKVSLTEEEREDLEDYIVSFINAKPSRVQQWENGDRAMRLDLIRKGYETFLPVVKPGASPVAKAASTASAGKTKIGLVNRTRNLPQNGSGKPQGQGNNKPLKIGDSALRDQAMKRLAELAAEREGAGD